MQVRHSLRRSTLVPVALAFLAPAWIGCHRDTGTAQLTSAASSSSPAATAKRTPIPDADIAQAIERHLKEDSAVRSDRIQVSVVNGICTLAGSVKTLLAKERALRVAETLKGVRSIIDQVDVKPVVRTDDQLKSDVMRELQQDRVTRTDLVSVAAKDGKVTLSGVAASWPEKGFFTQIAKTVRGVKAVDQISVKYPLVPSEAQVAEDVKHRIANDIWLDGNPIAVTVTGHTVHLEGLVGSVAEKARARSDGWLAGVDSVDDQGVVVDWAARDDRRHVADYAFRSDEDIARSVRDAFELDPRLVRLEPRVEAHNGIVDLTGTVESAKARRAAELDAKDTVGVTDVRNAAIVQPTGKPTDADVDRGVKRALADDLLLPDPAAIHASSSKGKVLLQGEIQSGFERHDAIEDVATIPGVSEIVDEMSIKRSPQDLKADIDDRLYWDGTVERDRVKVAVAPDSVATLSGTVDSWSEIRASVEDATLGGATHVINLLQIKQKP